MSTKRKVIMWVGVCILGVLLLKDFIDVPRDEDTEGGVAAREFARPFGRDLPEDVISSMTEFRARSTFGLFGGETFYSFKMDSNNVARLVRVIKTERHHMTTKRPQSPRLPPWWKEIMQQWPTNAVYYYKYYTPYEFWYLPDSQQCLLRWMAN